jgi:hypothetical protein
MTGDDRIFEVKFSNYLKYKPLLKVTGENVSRTKTTYNGSQIRLSDKDLPLYNEFVQELTNVVEQVLIDHNSNLKIVQPMSGWIVNYRKNGHQAPHRHGNYEMIVVSATLCFNNTEELFVANSGGKEFTSCDSPGLLRIFNSRACVHYAKPSPRARSIIVQDFLVNVAV